MKIIKRDGLEKNFDIKKIENAISKAFIAVDGHIDDTAKSIAHEIALSIENDARNAEEVGKTYSVEEIQDRVEDLLMESERHDVAKSYIRYREMRTREREKNSPLMKQVAEKLYATNVQNQNANVDEHSFGGRMGEARSVVSKNFAFSHVVSDMAYENHINNEVYIHDLDSFAVGEHNCLTEPLDDLLQTGFISRQTDVRPAGSIRSAFQLIAVIFQLQSLCQFGGVAAGHIDWTLVPYVRKSFKKHFRNGLKYIMGYQDVDSIIEKYLSYEEHPAYYYKDHTELRMNDERIKEDYPAAYYYAMDMTKEETYQSVEAMYHNLNDQGDTIAIL